MLALMDMTLGVAIDAVPDVAGALREGRFGEAPTVDEARGMLDQYEAIVLPEGVVFTRFSRLESVTGGRCSVGTADQMAAFARDNHHRG